MKSLCTIILTLLFFSTFSQINSVKIVNNVDCDFLNEQNNNELVLTKVNNENGGIEILFYNSSNDTLYLFDSYLNNLFYRSKYLHYYDKKNNLHLISFLPILPYVSIKHSDVFYVGEARLVKHNQIVYHFTTIKPNGCIKISFPNDLLEPDGYVKKIDIENLTVFSEPKFKIIKEKNIDINKCVAQFAVYKDIKVYKSPILYSFYGQEKYKTINIRIK